MSGRRATVRGADALVVLGAAVRPDGAPSPALRRRVRWAVELAQRGDASWLLLTGGVGRHPPSEASLMYRLAREQGIPAERLVLEERARTTWENARECAAIIRARGWGRVILVTDGFHRFRSLLAFRAFGVDALPCPLCRGHAGTRLHTALGLALREVLAIPWYALRVVVCRLFASRCR